MDPETRRLKKTPNLAEKALSDLEAQVSRVYLRLQRFRERYETQMTPEERSWLRQTCSEVERYLIKLAHSGRTQVADERADRNRKK